MEEYSFRADENVFLYERILHRIGQRIEYQIKANDHYS